jgi:HAD superfamily hydrolase (TIGR01484 family)
MAWTPLRELAPHAETPVAAVFTDLDDTLTTGGRLEAGAYAALWRLHEAHIPVVIVTGRPAGWCDPIARQWPVTGVVGENGALAYRYDPEARRMERRYALDPEARAEAGARLEAIRATVRRSVPEARVAADQPFRLFDLAIDFAEDVGPLSADAVDRIVGAFEAHGAHAKVSSIHVNGWFGDFDKLTMIRACGSAWFGWKDDLPATALYVGDSPNDEPAFAAFGRSVGVSNVRSFADRLRHPPTFVTSRPGGAGFAELVDRLLS